MKIFIIQNKKLISKTVILFVWLLFWQFLFVIINKEILIASPISVLKTFFSLSLEFSFWYTIFCSMIRILTGYLFSVFLGILFAILCYRSKILHDFFSPAIHTMKATPVASFSILVLLWIKTDFVPIVISFLMVFPLIWTNISIGIEQTQKQYLEMAKVYRFSYFKTYRYIYIPSILPYFISACHAGIGMAWKAGIAAEVICTPNASIGRKIYETKIYLETSELFVWTICAILFSILLEKCFLYLLYYISRKMGISYENKNNATI
ncbi:ABC transporter permease subunit [Clostridium sp. MD294]|uniref:ABC transporter permease n=1 Tax=Clostridium sp. MD294 TaxID=97138 RepID=UPI0002CC69AC|nr:ABC transporter permease subunit [Clostridium sp. MD294]NDO47325.1 ABC transporter permease subunit [Clostridium sp. MD294]USF29607.1 hypothetical protein C820_001007 [Clostridium sp. MD294]